MRRSAKHKGAAAADAATSGADHDTGGASHAAGAAAAVVRCRSAGCSFAAHAASGYCCDACRDGIGRHGTCCTAWLAGVGAFDATVCCEVKIPVPKWLLPPPLIRWLVPKLVSRIFWPLLLRTAHTFDDSVFGERFRADARVLRGGRAADHARTRCRRRTGGAAVCRRHLAATVSKSQSQCKPWREYARHPTPLPDFVIMDILA